MKNWRLCTQFLVFQNIQFFCLLLFWLYRRLCFNSFLFDFNMLQGKKIQNVKRDAFGSKLGRVHMTSQSLNQLQTRKMKGLRNPEKKRKRKPSGNVAITGTD